MEQDKLFFLINEGRCGCRYQDDIYSFSQDSFMLFVRQNVRWHSRQNLNGMIHLWCVNDNMDLIWSKRKEFVLYLFTRAAKLHFHLLSLIESLSVTQPSNLIIQKHQRKSKTKQKPKIISWDDIDIWFPCPFLAQYRSVNRKHYFRYQ